MLCISCGVGGSARSFGISSDEDGDDCVLRDALALWLVYVSAQTVRLFRMWSHNSIIVSCDDDTYTMHAVNSGVPESTQT